MTNSTRTKFLGNVQVFSTDFFTSFQGDAGYSRSIPAQKLGYTSGIFSCHLLFLLRKWSKNDILPYHIQEQEGKKVFDYDIFECPEELKGQLKIGDFYG